VPEQVALEQLQEKLEQLADDLIVEIEVVVR
jgi:glycine cleavage system regulatory protein